MEQSETIWGVFESSECAEALGCSEFRATVWRHPEALQGLRGFFAVGALWGGLQGLGGGGEKLRGVWSSLAGWFRDFKGFLEQFRAAESLEGFSTV